MPEEWILRRGGRRPVVTLAFALAYLAAGFLGRQTILDGTTFSLIWPAAGVAVLWLVVQQSGPLSLDTAALALVSFAANWFTGAPLEIALILMVTNTVQTVVTILVLRRWCPNLWGVGGDRSLDSPKVTAWYLGAISVGMAAGMSIGVAGTELTGGSAGVLQAVLWFDRNLCGVLAVTTLGLMVGQRLERPRPRPPLVDSDLELVLASVFSLVMYAVAFSFDGLPLAFSLLAATVWFGVRFSTVVSAWHSLLTGAAAVTLTLAGWGPFVGETGDEIAALLVQFFVGMILVSGVVLSTGREERRMLAAALRHTQEEAVYQADILNSVITSVVEGLIVIDDAGEILMVNPAAVEILGYSEAGELPRSVDLLGGMYLDGTPIPDGMRPSRRALAGEKLRNVDILFTTDDGHERILSMSAGPLVRDTQQDRARAVLMFRDATAEYAQRAELAAFAGVVAHDLRNPLAAIDGWTELLEDEALSGELHPPMVAEFVGRVRASSTRMHGLILHLLAHATSKDAALSLTRLDLEDAVRKVVAASEATHALCVRGQIPPVRGDRVLVDQVLENLVSNALKYVAEGVRPEIDVWATCGPSGMVTVSIADNGIGLPPGEHEAIFDEFHRAHVNGYEGTGLGLSICRRIIARHGGTISAHDNPVGQGTVFEFTLPAHA